MMGIYSFTFCKVVQGLPVKIVQVYKNHRKLIIFIDL